MSNTLIYIFMAKNRLDFQAHLSRHPHDVSAGYTCSMTTGQIIPMYFDVLLPGDSVYFTTHLFARLQDVVTAFLGEVDLHVDYFFVPLQMLYTPAGQILTQTDDVISSLFKNFPNLDYFPVAAYPYETTMPWQSTLFGHSECLGKEFARLLDAFDMNPLVPLNATLWSQGSTVTDSIDFNYTGWRNVSPWVPAAYQAIYQKYYRNDEVERLSVQDYNIDQYYTSSTFRNDRLFRLRYCQRPKDYFQSVRVSPIASAVNKLSGDTETTTGVFPNNGGNLGSLLNKVNDFLGYSAESNYQSVEFGSASDADSSSVVPFSSGTSYTKAYSISDGPLLSAANIRALFAIDKFTRIYGRAGKTYDDQILAHFGIKIPHDVKHDLTHIKHYHSSILADPVYSTSTSGNENGSVLGQVGGQGSTTINSGQEKFTAPVHGVFMAVAYAVTKPRYFGTFSKLHSLWTRLSFPLPEFDKLGAQPLYRFEASPIALDADFNRTAGPAYYDFIPPNSVIGSDSNVSALTEERSTPIGDYMVGWQNRYAQFKERYNRVSLNYLDPEMVGSDTSNVFSPWVLSRLPYSNGISAAEVIEFQSAFVGAEYLFESAHALDGVMAVPFNGNWSVDFYKSPHLMFNTDPLIVEFMCGCKKVSWMSETGEPDL